MNKSQWTVTERCSRNAVVFFPQVLKENDSIGFWNASKAWSSTDLGRERKPRKAEAEVGAGGGQGSSVSRRCKQVFSLSQEAELERLEREFAIQSQITEAARRLASDPNVSKKLKKQRKTSYLNALKKLQEIENAINENRIKSGKKPTQRASLVIDGQCHS